MNQRLKHFLTAENLSQAQFADILGVAKASISHILAGRNKPGFDFMESIALHFPTLSLGWLITGKGKMYATDSAASSPALFFEEQPEEAHQASHQRIDQESRISGQNAPQAQILNSVESKLNRSRSIERIIVFYSDGTFEEVR